MEQEKCMYCEDEVYLDDMCEECFNQWQEQVEKAIVEQERQYRRDVL